MESEPTRVKVPETVSDDIKRLVSRLHLSDDPEFVRCEPEPGSQPSDCFPTVAAKVQAEGGQRVLGWQIWELKLLVEAEFHAVWKSTTGELLDITPKDWRPSRIMFLPDPKAVYKGKQVDNVRLNITSNSLVDDLIAVSDALFRINNKGERAFQYGNDLRLPREDETARDTLWEAGAVLEQMAIAGDTRKSPCPCGSGKKYKSCHGRMIRQLVRKFGK